MFNLSCLPDFCPGFFNKKSQCFSTSSTGPTSTGRLLKVDQYRGRNKDINDKGRYFPPETATWLHIRLWGAGGGGAGAGQSSVVGTLPIVGGGGGAGGYAEGWIPNSSESYEFFLASGGSGGVNSTDGEDAMNSYFLTYADFHADGGSGGKCLTNSNDFFPQGGTGGSAGGSLATICGKGGSGGTGNLLIGLIGAGGTNSAGSSSTSAPATIIDVYAPVVVGFVIPGASAWLLGSGGDSAGLLTLNANEFKTASASGGRGAPATLIVSAYIGRFSIPPLLSEPIKDDEKTISLDIKTNTVTILQIKSIDTIGYGIFIPPADTKWLFVSLWGAGGGGGGCVAITEETEYWRQFGAGGGGGGYVEGWIPNRKVSYDFYIAEGGLGGIDCSSGYEAWESWFSDPAHLYVTGGGGGSVGMGKIPMTRRGSTSSGGRGGSAGGTFMTLAASGMHGSSGWTGLVNITSTRSQGGQGGAAGQKSGMSPAVSLTTPGSVDGNLGLAYGGGGSGACTFAPNVSARGGKGANGNLFIVCYG